MKKIYKVVLLVLATVAFSSLSYLCAITVDSAASLQTRRHDAPFLTSVFVTFSIFFLYLSLEAIFKKTAYGKR